MSISTVEELDAVFIDAFSEVISTSTGVALELISSESDPGFFDVTAGINLSGNKQGMLFISAAHDTALTLCSYMTGVMKEDATEEDIIDAMCEFANMTAGNAKLRLGNSEFLFSLSSPFVIEGKEMSITTKRKVHVLSTTFSCNDFSIKMKLILV